MPRDPGDFIRGHPQRQQMFRFVAVPNPLWLRQMPRLAKKRVVPRLVTVHLAPEIRDHARHTAHQGQNPLSPRRLSL